MRQEPLELLSERPDVLEPGVADEIETSIEPEGEARFRWLLARRPE